MRSIELVKVEVRRSELHGGHTNAIDGDWRGRAAGLGSRASPSGRSSTCAEPIPIGPPKKVTFLSRRRSEHGNTSRTRSDRRSRPIATALLAQVAAIRRLIEDGAALKTVAPRRSYRPRESGAGGFRLRRRLQFCSMLFTSPAEQRVLRRLPGTPTRSISSTKHTNIARRSVQRAIRTFSFALRRPQTLKVTPP